MRLVYKFYIRHTEELDRLFQISNNLYNQALYLFRQHLDTDGTWLWYNDMDKLMKKTTNLEGECNYKLLKSQCSQQILRVLDKNIKAYCKSIKDWKKHPEKYKGMPKMLHYRKRGGMFNLYYTNQSCSIKDGRIRLAKDLFISVPQWEKYGESLKSVHQVRLIPNSRNIKVEIVYEKEIEQTDVDKAKYASIDLGLDNLATMVTSEGCTIYSGKYLKSYNNHFNKTLSHLQSIKDLQGIKRTTRRITRMYDKRDRYFEDAFQKVSRQIVDTLVRNRIGTLVVGYNAGWKQNSDMGKKNNQKFVQMPFARLADYLRYKCEMIGIKFIMHEENYTSKCDALALEPIGKHETYLGCRVKRGLFRSSTGKMINADQNGALNILRKVVGDSEFSRIVGSGHSLCPIRYRNPFQTVAGSM
ncbi:MAG: RNA-guided endonuclease InsQ/TnpB family protein [Prevotella pectinovora]